MTEKLELMFEEPDGKPPPPHGYFRVYNDGPGDVKVFFVEQDIPEWLMKNEPYVPHVSESFILKAGQMDERFPRSPYPITSVRFESLDKLGGSCRVFKGSRAWKCMACGEWIAEESIKRNGSHTMNSECPKCGKKIFSRPAASQPNPLRPPDRP